MLSTARAAPSGRPASMNVKAQSENRRITRLLPVLSVAILIVAPESYQGVYQIGDVYALSCNVAGTFDGRSML
jgi:hypothetical protein